MVERGFHRLELEELDELDELDENTIDVVADTREAPG